MELGLWVIDSDQDREEATGARMYGPAVKIMQERRESGVIIMSSGAVMESWPGSVSIILIRENISSASGQKPAPAQSPLSALSALKLYSASATSTSSPEMFRGKTRQLPGPIYSFCQQFLG